MFNVRNLTALGFIFGLLPVLSVQSMASDISAGPLVQQFKLTLDPGHRTEVVSPLFYTQELGEEPDITRVWAAPPFFSYSLNEDLDYESIDILWKGITYDRYGTEYRFQIVQLFSFAGGQTQSETNASRFTLFPFYFQQRSGIPEKNYTALFPIYGRIRQRLFRDDINFILFPLYGQTRKRDVITDNYLFPVFHLRHGDGLNGWQFWPLAGREHKEVTTKTNAWGDLETVGGHEKQFILWPLFFDHRTEIGTTNVTHQQSLLPFYTYLRSADRDSTSYLWPLGVTHTIERGKKYDEWGLPWPLVVFAHGEGKTTRRVWPFFSQSHNDVQTGAWYLWPIYKYNRLHSDPLDRERTRILFFLYSDVSVKHTETGARLRQIDLWPLFTLRHDLEGRNRLQFFAPLEPILPNNSSVQRNLSPLWSLWRSEHNTVTGAASQSLLWNLYRRDTTPAARKCSLLFGLIQYQSSPGSRRWRVCYVPFGKSNPATEPAVQ